MLKTKEIGTSTATLISVKNDTLKTANLGDSAYAIYSINNHDNTTSKFLREFKSVAQ